MSTVAVNRSEVRIITGPTGAGKSALAMQLAERYGLTIVSADSRQIYRGFDIGTAKPTPDEQRRVPHYGIDVVAPTARYSAHQWASDARQWRTACAAHGSTAVIVGGTGFYVRALVQPLDEVPALDPAQREALAPWLTSLSNLDLTRWCTRLDPARAHLGRTQQLRAVETALLAGYRLSDAFGTVHSEPLEARYLVIDPGAALSAWIETRVSQMVAAGWVEEVRQLSAAIPDEAPAWKASGYQVLRDVVDGRRSLSEALERVVIETRQYAKRQRTWLRHQLPAAQVTHVDSRDADAFRQVCAWWETDDWSKS
jgi:tRNA dimethylallyltransferase